MDDKIAQIKIDLKHYLTEDKKIYSQKVLDSFFNRKVEKISTNDLRIVALLFKIAYLKAENPIKLRVKKEVGLVGRFVKQKN